MARETDEKVERVAQVARETRVGGILLTTQRNVAWLTGGGTTRIDGSRETGAGALLVTADAGRFVVANAIEMPRLMAEVVPGLSFEPIEYPWIDDQANPAAPADIVRTLLPRGAIVGADWPLRDTKPSETAIMRKRVPLMDEEIARYRALGREMGDLVGMLCRSLRPGESEERIAALVSARICATGARPIVTLVAADDRLARYRHPVPTAAAWRDTVMVVVCAERHGLVVALSRIVTTGKPSTELRDRTRATAQVFTRLMAGTRSGVTGSDLYAVAANAYEAVGFRGEERKHHQGGAIGYRSREWIAHPASEEVVAARQAFAWNPSITGTKVEDTVLLNDGRYEWLTASPFWPAIPLDVNGATMPVADVLSLSASPAGSSPSARS
jgi:Xaa-Pro aminopeptidase